jgi:hypothetical protein
MYTELVTSWNISSLYIDFLLIVAVDVPEDTRSFTADQDLL